MRSLRNLKIEITFMKDIKKICDHYCWFVYISMTKILYVAITKFDNLNQMRLMIRNEQWINSRKNWYYIFDELKSSRDYWFV